MFRANAYTGRARNYAVAQIDIKEEEAWRRVVARCTA